MQRRSTSGWIPGCSRSEDPPRTSIEIQTMVLLQSSSVAMRVGVLPRSGHSTDSKSYFKASTKHRALTAPFVHILRCVLPHLAEIVDDLVNTGREVAFGAVGARSDNKDAKLLCTCCDREGSICMRDLGSASSWYYSLCLGRGLEAFVSSYSE